MNHVLLLGAGLVTRPLVQYLLEKPDLELTIASRTVSKAEKLIGGHERGTAMQLLVDDQETLSRLVAKHDLIISLLPYTYHVKVAKLCIQHRKMMVTTSYVSPAMKALDQEAREAGILILNEIGLDPGIDHMSAMRVIDDVKNRGGKVTSFMSYCGGLPAPEANTNPWGYKFSWSPGAVVMAGKNPGKFLRDGKVVEIPGPELFGTYEMVSVPGAGSFEGYTNRDCLGYIEIYGLQDASTMFRGTLRYTGWCDTLKAITDLGYPDDAERNDLQGKSFAELMRLLVPGAKGKEVKAAVAEHLGLTVDSNPIERMDWLGLFSDEPLPQALSTMDVLVARMAEKLPYEPGQRDMIVLHHDFKAELPDHMEHITSTLIDYGIPNGDSAMSRTVSLPAAVATRLILEGKITMTGVHIPVDPVVYNPVLDELERMGIACKERTEKQ
ncbi:MAG: saccharopine dehydrogenase NADP-binding domain-containing protein [Candidatus Eisenbacteria sp.]|nr:saccharopine dehydrogenase NADP-binding domain-containing protein [Candidatus Eisenbacteria bacterium]